MHGFCKLQGTSKRTSFIAHTLDSNAYTYGVFRTSWTDSVPKLQSRIICFVPLVLFNFNSYNAGKYGLKPMGNVRAIMFYLLCF